MHMLVGGIKCYECIFVVFKQKTAYKLRISDWSSDVCSSDLPYLPASETRHCCRHSTNPPDPMRRRSGRRPVRQSPRSFQPGPPAKAFRPQSDRKSVVSGKRVAVRVDLGGRRIIKQQHLLTQHYSISTYTVDTSVTNI